jgi:cell division protein FtsB
MLTKIKKIILNIVLPNLRDMRIVSLVVLAVLAILTSWSGIQLAEVNYNLQQEIATLEAKNRITALENENLRLKSQYLTTDTYLELVARQQFSKGAKGETLVIIPEKVALAHAPEIVSSVNETDQQPDSAPFYVKNLRAWRE